MIMLVLVLRQRAGSHPERVRGWHRCRKVLLPVPDVNWTTAAPAVTTAFLSSLVEAVEALTTVLAVTFVRGYRRGSAPSLHANRCRNGRRAVPPLSAHLRKDKQVGRHLSAATSGPRTAEGIVGPPVLLRKSGQAAFQHGRDGLAV
jgi:hypothetical protein